MDYRKYLRFNPETKKGEVNLEFIIHAISTPKEILIDDLINRNSILVNFIIDNKISDYSSIRRYIRTEWFPAKFLQELLNFKARIKPLLTGEKATQKDIDTCNKWNDSSADLMVAKELGYVLFSSLPNFEKAEYLIGEIFDNYSNAFYKGSINAMWKLYFGRNLHEIIENKDETKYMARGDGRPLYILLVEALGSDFEDYYDQVNPRIPDKEFRKYTYTNVMYRHPILIDVLNTHISNLNNLMHRVAEDFDLFRKVYELEYYDEELRNFRSNVRNHEPKGLYYRVRNELPTIEKLVNFLTSDKMINPKSFLPPDAA